MPSLPGSATSRRTAIGGAVTGLLVLAGCDLEGSGSEPRLPPRRGGTAGSDDPDSALVDRVVAELDELEALVRVASRQRPSLAPRLAGLAETHRAHRSVLTDEDRPATAGVRLRGTRAEVVEQVLRRERVGRDRLAGWAVDAESGALARLLASMSAGIAVRLADDAVRRG